MPEVPTGPCLPHCYSCPTSVVYASNAAIALTIGLLVFLLGTLKLDNGFKDSLPPRHIEAYECMQNRRTMYLIAGITLGAVVLIQWKPYTQYKLV